MQILRIWTSRLTAITSERAARGLKSLTLDGSHLRPCQLESLHATNPAINCQTPPDGTVSHDDDQSSECVYSSSNLVIYMLRGI